MSRLYFLLIICLAIGCLFLISFSMWREANPRLPAEQEQTPVISHPISPFKSYITGVGIVEASSENIFIGTPVQRIVTQVMVTVGERIKKGDVLLQLEDRDLKSDLMARQVAYEIAQAKMKKLEALPRPEDVSSAEASLKSAQVELSHAKNQYEMAQGLGDSRAISQEEINRRRFNYEQAESKWQQTQVNLDKIKAGTWKPDLEIAYLEAQEAKANADRIKTEIERTIVRSPIDGKVLQINIHEGEVPPIDTSKTPLMVVGNTDEKYLSVSINQFNAPYFRPNAPAVAFLQGDYRDEFPLEFVFLEPYLVKKQNFNNELTEKVDTRVLHVTYRFKEGSHNIFVGQQMDVFIEDEHVP